MLEPHKGAAGILLNIKYSGHEIENIYFFFALVNSHCLPCSAKSTIYLPRDLFDSENFSCCILSDIEIS